MTEAANTIDDSPADSFTIFVYCDACDRSAPLDRSRVPHGMTIPHIIQVLRCSSCEPYRFCPLVCCGRRTSLLDALSVNTRSTATPSS